jgi:aspartate-semialdehyde dehydrogenase
MSFSIAIIGATGSVGQELVRVLEQAPFEIGRLVAVGTRASVGRRLEYAGQEVTVKALTADVLQDLDLVFVATRGPLARGLLDDALDDGVRMVDLAGIWRDEPGVPTVAMAANPEDLQVLREVGVVHAPGPLTLALTHILGPLHAAFSLLGVRGSAFLPATIEGRAGTEELSNQVVSLFNAREPQRKVFPDGLAFDLLPVWGAVGDDGWSELERESSAQVVTMLGMDRAVMGVTATVAPLFAGMALSLHLVGEGRITAETAREALQGIGTLRICEDTRDLAVRKQVGQGRIALGRFRDDPGGSGVHLWAACDPLRLSAANAASIGAAVLRERL